MKVRDQAAETEALRHERDQLRISLADARQALAVLASELCCLQLPLEFCWNHD